MSKQTTDNLLENLDLTDLAFKVSQLAMSMMTGQNIPTTPVKVEVEVPTALLETVEHIAMATGQSSEVFLGALASQGLNSALTQQAQMLGNKPQPKEPEPDELGDLAGKLGIDMSKFNNTFGKLEGLATQLQDMQKVLENVAKPDKKNTK